VIDAAGIDRVLQISSGKVQIRALTVEHGRSNDGGGIQNSGGRVTLTSVVVANNLAVGGAGASAINGSGAAGFSGDAAFGGGI
jgi:hypothetical protein